MALEYVPASVLTTLALRPDTVYLLPSTVNSRVLKPSAICSLPSYVNSAEFDSTSISYFASRLVTVSVPSDFVMV